MGKVYEKLTDTLREFIQRQPMFFVGTAPRSDQGLVNVSPKGLDSLRVLDEQTVAYADITGSGVETLAHLKENGRITLMFCAFDGAPKIVRLSGRGEVFEPSHARFPELSEPFSALPGLRSIIVVHCERIADSCGFGVPLMEYQGQRNELITATERLGPDGIAEYRLKKNRTSLDGLPGVEAPESS